MAAGSGSCDAGVVVRKGLVGAPAGVRSIDAGPRERPVEVQAGSAEQAIPNRKVRRLSSTSVPPTRPSRGRIPPVRR